jgi:SET domain-containing protein
MQKITLASDSVYIDQSQIEGAGRGVFAKQDIDAGEMIEVSPMLVLDSWLVTWGLRLTPLRNYFYQWGKNRRVSALALGFGSLYNHNFDPNAVYEKDIEQRTITFTAREDIAEGEEITINYNGHPEDMRVLWDESITQPNDAENPE